MDPWVKQVAEKMGARIVGEVPGYLGAPIDPRNLRAIAAEYQAETEEASGGTGQTTTPADDESSPRDQG
jgi:hypothetical protein